MGCFRKKGRFLAAVAAAGILLGIQAVTAWIRSRTGRREWMHLQVSPVPQKAEIMDSSPAVRRERIHPPPFRSTTAPVSLDAAGVP